MLSALCSLLCLFSQSYALFDFLLLSLSISLSLTLSRSLALALFSVPLSLSLSLALFSFSLSLLRSFLALSLFDDPKSQGALLNLSGPGIVR